MTVTFHVTNFDKHQHYRDRTPPWIKLYNELLDDYTFGKLPDAAKAHLLAIWLLASRSDNCLPLDADWVARRINATAPVDLQVLLDAGFLKANDSAAGKPLAKRKRNACPEREGETEREEETERETERETEQKHLSDPPGADADPSMIFLKGEGKEAGQENPPDQETEPDPQTKAPPRRSASWRKSYPPEFEAFWAGYPNDPIMSKVRALLRWECLSLEDRNKAQAALPAFRKHCARNPTYRPVHAERYLSQRRFDGLLTPAPAVPPDLAVAKACWGGAAAPLVDEIGAAAFNAYFGAATFDAGPPARIVIAKAALRDLARDKYTAALGRALGAFELVEKLPANTRAQDPPAAAATSPPVSWPANAGHP